MLLRVFIIARGYDWEAVYERSEKGTVLLVYEDHSVADWLLRRARQVPIFITDNIQVDDKWLMEVGSFPKDFDEVKYA